MTKNNQAAAEDPVTTLREQRRKTRVAGRNERRANREEQDSIGTRTANDVDRTARGFLQGLSDGVVAPLVGALNRVADAINGANANNVGLEAVRAEVIKLRDAVAAAEAHSLAASAHKKGG